MISDSVEVQELDKLKQEAAKYYNYEQSIKNVLNSVYGAFGNQHFAFYNVDIAETITLQGKDAILYTEAMVNKYFREFWPNDKAVHAALGINITGAITQPVGIYIDTDSIVGDSLIRLSDGRKITVADLYDEGKTDMGDTLAGHESVSCELGVLNWSEDRGLYYAPVKRVIRHRVSKERWLMTTDNGYSVTVTGDHSLIVFRDGSPVEIKPKDVIVSDTVAIVFDTYDGTDVDFRQVSSIECIGSFDDEYVYDIEVDDDTHTFIANDILVHNSIYMKFDEVIKKSTWEGSERDFILKLYEVRLRAYIDKIMEKYAVDNNAENYLSFELESIAKNAIWLAKKKYMQNIVWKDPNLYYDDLTKVSAKGFEIIQSSTPLFARQKLKGLLTFIFSEPKFDMKQFASMLKEIKREFKLANIDHISMSKKVNNYQNYILNDYEQFEIGPKCPIGVRAAGYHNYLLNNSPHKKKYKLLGNGEKLKLYFSKDPACEVFSYAPGDFPYEFAPEIDYDVQFEKTIIDPINRVLHAMGYKGFNRNLIYVTGVF